MRADHLVERKEILLSHKKDHGQGQSGILDLRDPAG